MPRSNPNSAPPPATTCSRPAAGRAGFDAYRAIPLEQRARFLEAIADRIMDIGPLLIERAGQESGLPQARLEGERGRTVNQLRLFAKVVRDGHFLEATLDSALPQRTPPRPDLRMRKIALGPVAVFGASNFPLAFSVAGGDTASALAAGCPVVVKAHNAHLGTSELVGQGDSVRPRRMRHAGGRVSMLIGEGNQIGQDLVGHPAIKAVGFTGSRGAAWRCAHRRGAQGTDPGVCRNEQHQSLLPAAGRVGRRRRQAGLRASSTR
jgi:alpha-ketoglutaric semialdehyde dehydrogenase